MYPSDEFPSRAIFVRTLEQGLLEYGAVITHRTVLSIVNVSWGRKIFEYARFYIRVIKWGLLKRDYDIMYVHFGSLCALPVLFVKLLTGKKIVLNVHGSDIIPVETTCKILLPLTILLAYYSEFIVVPSFFFKQATLRLLKHFKREIVVSPSGGIDTTIFKPAKDKHSIKQTYGFENDDLIVGYVSRIDEGKGWDVFIDVVAELLWAGVSVKGLMAGGGEQVQQLSNKLAYLKVDGAVKYIGAQDHSMLPNVFNCMDVFLFPTLLFESFGLVAIEAMACGIPVIASNVGAIPDFVHHGQNGFLCSPGNRSEFFQYSALLLKNREKQSGLARQALETVNEYERKNVAIQLMNKLKNIQLK